jgi:hypothetical protein
MRLPLTARTHQLALRRPRRSVLAAVLLGLIAGCAGKSLDASPGANASGSDGGSEMNDGGLATNADGSLKGGPPVAEGDFCKQYTLAVCGALKGCCNTPSSFDETTCISRVRSSCDGDLQSAPQSGGIYVPELGGSCIAKAQNDVCTVDTEASGYGWDLYQRCPTVFRATLTAGQACSPADRWCVSGLSCVGHPAPPPPDCGGHPCDTPDAYTCTKLPTAGEPCDSGRCAEGFACNGTAEPAVCMVVGNVPLGGGCASAEQCQTGLFCDTKAKTCQAPRGISDLCADHTECASDVCTDGVCTPAAPKSIAFCTKSNTRT